jgi:hypothetical protein
MSPFFVASFIEIIHHLSDSLLQCDANTRIAELLNDEFDDVDFEMALCCFEATHRMTFVESLQSVPFEQYEDLSIEEFLEKYLDPEEQTDPLFVTKRFRMFEDTLTRALLEEGEGPKPY